MESNHIKYISVIQDIYIINIDSEFRSNPQKWCNCIRRVGGTEIMFRVVQSGL